MAQIFVRQIRTGRVYIVDPAKPATELFLRRKDIAKYDPDTAQARIKALQDRIEKLDEIEKKGVSPEIVDDAATIRKLEKEIEAKEKKLLDNAVKEQGGEVKEDKTPEQIAADEKQKIIDEDPEIGKIDAMTKKVDVQAYILEEYGQKVDVDKDTKLKDLKQRAINLRIDRLFEE